MTLHEPGVFGTHATKCHRPATKAEDSLPGFQTGYLGVLQRNDDNDEGRESNDPGEEGVPIADNDDNEPGPADDDFVALKLQVGVPGGMPDELKGKCCLLYTSPSPRD